MVHLSLLRLSLSVQNCCHPRNNLHARNWKPHIDMHHRIKNIGSNKSYWIYLHIHRITVMVT